MKRRRRWQRVVLWTVTNLAAGALIGIGFELVRIEEKAVQKEVQTDGKAKTEDLYNWALREQARLKAIQGRKESPQPAATEIQRGSEKVRNDDAG